MDSNNSQKKHKSPKKDKSYQMLPEENQSELFQDQGIKVSSPIQTKQKIQNKSSLKQKGQKEGKKGKQENLQMSDDIQVQVQGQDGSNTTTQQEFNSSNNNVQRNRSNSNSKWNFFKYCLLISFVVLVLLFAILKISINEANVNSENNLKEIKNQGSKQIQQKTKNQIKSQNKQKDENLSKIQNPTKIQKKVQDVYAKEVAKYKIQQPYNQLKRTLQFWMMTGKNVSQSQELQQFAEAELKYFEEKYQISKYGQIQLCVLIPSYMNQANERYKRNLDSILQQNYTNYKVYYIDDYSTDKTGEFVEKYIKERKVQNKVKLYKNTVKRGKSYNQFYVGHQNCKPGSVMVVVDGDDQLIGKQVFKFLSAAYQSTQFYYLYTHSALINVRTKGVTKGYSVPVAPETIEATDYRKKNQPSHLRTWMSDLYLDIKKEDLYVNGTFPMTAEDVGTSFELMQKAGKRVGFISQFIYRYVTETGFNDFAHNGWKKQAQVQKYYRNFSKYPVYNKTIKHSIKSLEQIQKIKSQKEQPTQFKVYTIIEVDKTQKPTQIQQKKPNDQKIQTQNKEQKLNQTQIQPKQNELKNNNQQKNENLSKIQNPTKIQKKVQDVYAKEVAKYKIQQPYNQLKRTLQFWMMTGKNVSQSQELQQFAEAELKYFEEKYQISKYGQIQLCVLIPSYMNQANERYKRNLDSILQQNYTNYKVYYIDDYSTDKTGEFVEKYIKERKVQNKVKLYKNTVKRGKSYNQFYVGHQNCKPGSVMVVVDGDDQLIGKQVFKFLSAAYQSTQFYYLYTHSALINVRTKGVTKGFSVPVAPETIEATDYRKKNQPSHLRTWMSDLYLDIKKEDLYVNGTFPMTAEDVGTSFELMQKAGKRVGFISQFIYRYVTETGFNDFAHNGWKKQAQVQKYYRNFSKYPVYNKTIKHSIKSLEQIQKIKNQKVQPTQFKVYTIEVDKIQKPTQIQQKKPNDQKIQTQTKEQKLKQTQIQPKYITFQQSQYSKYVLNQPKKQLKQALQFWYMNGKNISENQELIKLAQREKNYFESKYNISKYGEVQLCVVVVSYMNEGSDRYKKNLNSILQQQYTNYQVYYVVDYSTDRTAELVQKYIKDRKVQSKVKLYTRTERKGKSYNQFYVAQQNCKPGSVMVVIDGDDELIGRQAFKFLSAYYQSSQLYYIYTHSAIIVQQDKYVLAGFSRPFSAQTIKTTNYRKNRQPSHLRTWVSDLFLDIKKEDLYVNGTFPMTAEDVGTSFELTQKAGTKVGFINQFIYRYVTQTGYNDYMGDGQKKQAVVQKYYRNFNKFEEYKKPITLNIKSLDQIQKMKLNEKETAKL